MCLSTSPDYDEDTDLIIFGDDGGFVNVLYMHKRFLVDTTGDVDVSELTAAKIQKKDSLERHNICLVRVKLHSEWVLKVHYYSEMNTFISCANESVNSMVIGDFERKINRSISVPNGITCFEVSRRPSFILTGGRDKIIRLWNPYILSKPAGQLSGHNAAIMSIVVNHEDCQVISLSEDKVIKIWNVRNLNCLQTLTDKIAHRPENILSAMYFDSFNRRILTGSSKIEIWPLIQGKGKSLDFQTSHEHPIVAAIYNNNFNQVK